jgi:hypothetical protein
MRLIIPGKARYIVVLMRSQMIGVAIQENLLGKERNTIVALITASKALVYMPPIILCPRCPVTDPNAGAIESPRSIMSSANNGIC